MLSSFRLLVITDIHYAPGATAPDAIHTKRRVELSLELFRRAIEDAKHRGGFDCIAILGDLLNDAASCNAASAILDLQKQIELAGAAVPVIAIPGNHDGPAENIFAAFGPSPAVKQVGSYRFVSFADRFAQDDAAARSEADRRFFADVASVDGGPIVVLQHNPINPVIDDPYPYMLSNRQQVLADYAKANVLLSLSGHAHPGQAENMLDGVTYFTAPSLCQEPFQYTIVSLEGRNVKIQTHRLALPDKPAIVDCHVHTQFAYCGKGITAAGNIAQGRRMGLAGLCLVEHSPHLYCKAEDFWEGAHIRRAGAWKNPEHFRIAQFREHILPLRSDFVKIGLEVELDAGGELIINDQDKDWIDLIVGAVHFLPKESKSMNDAEMMSEFMRVSEGLLLNNIDVLAHPMRYFQWAGRQEPRCLYRPLAQMLRQSGTAAEINFHCNMPEAEFFAVCVQEGVKIAFGSDTHETHEVGSLGANLQMLQEIAGRQDVSDLLYYP